MALRRNRNASYLLKKAYPKYSGVDKATPKRKKDKKDLIRQLVERQKSPTKGIRFAPYDSSVVSEIIDDHVEEDAIIVYPDDSDTGYLTITQSIDLNTTCNVDETQGSEYVGEVTDSIELNTLSEVAETQGSEYVGEVGDAVTLTTTANVVETYV